MTVRVSLVRSVCAANGLDLLQVYDQAKRQMIFEARGTADVLQALDTLPDELNGTFRLVGTQQGAKGKEAPAFEWVVSFNGSGDDAPRGVGSVDGGPTWREYIELREELLTMRLREEMAPASPGPWDKIAEMLPQMLPGIMGKAAPVVPAAAAQPVAGAAADGGALPPDVLAAAQNVVKLFKQQPQTFAQYAPVLHDLVNGSDNGEA